MASLPRVAAAMASTASRPEGAPASTALPAGPPAQAFLEMMAGSGSYGVFSNGNFGASGTKSFRIDHPSDPLHKFLLHYCSEGPEPLNIYSGNVTTDARGAAWVQLPAYFAEINKEPRYQ